MAACSGDRLPRRKKNPPGELETGGKSTAGPLSQVPGRGGCSVFNLGREPLISDHSHSVTIMVISRTMLDLRHLKNDVGSTTSGGAYLRDAIDAAINGPCASRQLSAGPNKGPRLPPPGQAIGLKISSVQKKMGVATLRLVKALSSVADRIHFQFNGGPINQLGQQTSVAHVYIHDGGRNVCCMRCRQRERKGFMLRNGVTTG